jgi:hypothetical protein
METTEQAGSEVERLYAEMELRVAIAVPLAVTALVLVTQSHDAWWLLLLIAPIVLLVQATVLNRHGGLQMVESLRSRDAEQLRKIAPAFGRYEDRASGLAEEIEERDWTELVRSELEKNPKTS